MKVPWYFVFSFLFFCLGPNVRKNTWMKTASVTVLVILSKVLFWKLLDHRLFLNNYEAYWQQDLRDTLQLKILWKWINIHANHFLVKHMKQKLTKVVGKRSRSSSSEVFLGKSVLNIFIKFTGEHPCRSAISTKLLCNFLEIRTSAWVFSWKFAAYFQKTFS